jgi:SPP1 gp7 family putative phage head morphogenesis protein
VEAKMSTTHQHAHLRQLTTDPTNTQELRDRFLRKMRGRFRRVRGAVRRAVGYEKDVFGLGGRTRLADAEDVEQFQSDERKVKAFTDWLTEKVNKEVLEPAGGVANGQHWTGTFIRAAYTKGWKQARARLQNQGIATEEFEDILQLGVPQEQLAKLYTRTFENLQSITADVVPAVRDVLTQGLAEGVNPKEMARRLTDEIETIQRTQAEVLARTEIINSYSEATLDRYDRAQVDGVTVSGEFATADDDRVCPICEAIEGAEFGTDEMRDATFEFEPSDSEPDSLGGVFPVKPPVHCNCRCAILPVVE